MGRQILKVLECDSGYEYQGPRFIKLGPFSGELFRDSFLLPWLEKYGDKENTLEIDFTGTTVYTPSFLEEAFGGAVRKGYKNTIENVIFSNIPDKQLEKVERYIREAKVEKK